MHSNTHTQRVRTGVEILLHVTAFFAGIKLSLRGAEMMQAFFLGESVLFFGQPPDQPNGLGSALIGVGLSLTWIAVYALTHELEPYILQNRTGLREKLARITIEDDDEFVNKYLESICICFATFFGLYFTSSLIMAVTPIITNHGISDEVIISIIVAPIIVYGIGAVGRRFKATLSNWT